MPMDTWGGLRREGLLRSCGPLDPASGYCAGDVVTRPVRMEGGRGASNGGVSSGRPFCGMRVARVAGVRCQTSGRGACQGERL
jgi:hypothetical protein